MKKRRVEVMIETHQTWIIRKPSPTPPLWCQQCSQPVPLVTAEEAALLVCRSTRTIYRLVEARRLHYRETPSGSLFVCLDSLFAGAGEAAHAAPEILAALEPTPGARRDRNQET